MLQMLEPTVVKLSNVQTRVEKHGEDEVIAIDLAVTWNTNNRSLIAIQKQLRNALFCDLRQEAGGDQEEMDLPVDEMPNVRVPGMDYPVKLDFQQVGARVEVAFGISEVSAIVLNLCKIGKMRVTPIEGGSAEVKFAISSSADIDDHIIGTLSVLQQREISLKLTMPEVEQPTKPLTEGDVFGDPPAQTDEEKAKALADEALAKSVEQAFVNDSKAPAEKPARKSKKGAE